VRVDQAQPEVQEAHAFPLELMSEFSPSGTPVDNVKATTSLKSMLEKVQTPWTHAVVVVPPDEYLSLNVELPFASGKNVQKILDLEVQDKVPFDPEEFLVHPKAVGALESNEQDFHVALWPRARVRRLLEVFRAGQIEPYVLTPPTAALGALSSLQGVTQSENAVLVHVHQDYLAATCWVRGALRADRTIKRRGDRNAHTIEVSTIQDLRLTMSAWQTRYGIQFSEVILLSDVLESATIQTALGSPVRTVRPSELTTNLNGGPALAACAALFGKDELAPKPLSNFRSREFSYSPQLAELRAGLSSLLPYLVATLGILLLALTATYLFREHRISQIEEGIQMQLQKSIPTLVAPSGNELAALDGENRRLEQQLQNLGSLSSLSPLDYFAEIAEDLPTSSGITISRVKIEKNTLRVEGTAPGYAELEKIERMLKRKKTVYCKVRKDSTGAATGKPNARGYVLDITLCD
jgi:hypothetical protein